MKHKYILAGVLLSINLTSCLDDEFLAENPLIKRQKKPYLQRMTISDLMHGDYTKST